MRVLLARSYRTFFAMTENRYVKHRRRYHYYIFQIPPHRLSLTYCQLELKRTGNLRIRKYRLLASNHVLARSSDHVNQIYCHLASMPLVYIVSTCALTQSKPFKQMGKFIAKNSKTIECLLTYA